MTVLLPWFALVVTILAGWAIIKRLSTSMVLLFAGLAMISFAVICGVHGFLPKGVKPSCRKALNLPASYGLIFLNCFALSQLNRLPASVF